MVLDVVEGDLFVGTPWNNTNVPMFNKLVVYTLIFDRDTLFQPDIVESLLIFGIHLSIGNE